MVFWIVVFVAALFLIPFAVSNRAVVSLGLWPLPFLIDLPLYLLVLLMLLVGFVAGATTAWMAGHRARRELRRRRRRAEGLEDELKAARSELESQFAKKGQRVPV